MRKVIVVSKIDDIMKEVAQLALQNELIQLEKLDIGNIEYKPLYTDDINKLAVHVNLLPLEYKNILFLRYCFDSTFLEVNKILEMDYSMGKLRYTLKMLSNTLGLDNKWIDDNSMKKICELALDEEMKTYSSSKIKHKPDYTRNFKKKLKDIDIKEKANITSIGKRVAVFILVCLLSFSVILAVNAEVRGRVINWFIEVFPKFSIFTSYNTDESIDSAELTEYGFAYIPQGFELINKHELNAAIIYNYVSEKDQELDIKLVDSSSAGRSYYNTEDVKIEEITIKESQGYIWQKNEIASLVWEKDGTEFHITGNLNIDEIIKIAENIYK